MKPILLLKISMVGMALILCQFHVFAQKAKSMRQQTVQPVNVKGDPDDGGEVTEDPDGGGEIFGDPDDGGEIAKGLIILLPETSFLVELEMDVKLITGNKKLSSAQRKSAFIQALTPASQVRRMDAGQFRQFLNGLASASGNTSCRTTIEKCLNGCQRLNPDNTGQCQQNCLRQFLSCSAGAAKRFGMPIPDGTSLIR